MFQIFVGQKGGLIITRNILPESQSIGQLDLHSQVIELTGCSRPALTHSLAGGSDNRPAQILAHELCHWADIVGTVWGQEYLDLVFTAMDEAAYHPDGPAGSYPAAIKLFDAERAIFAPAYYKTINPSARPTSDQNPWGISFTAGAWIKPTGQLDDSRPIFFVRFNDASDGSMVARQPMTVGALLELRAITAEIATLEEWLQTQPQEEAMVARKLFQRERIAEFYHPVFTTYSVAAHLLSFGTGEHDFVPVCRGGASLADLCLNITPNKFPRLRAPNEFREFTPPRLAGFRSSFDRGYVFACLAFHARELGLGQINGLAVSRLVEVVGFDSVDAIYDRAEHFFQFGLRPSNRLGNPELRRMREALTAMGVAVLQWRRSRAGAVGTAGEFVNAGMPSPVVMTSDCQQFTLAPNGIAVADSEFLHARGARVSEVTRDALRAGRGLEDGFDDYVY